MRIAFMATIVLVGSLTGCSLMDDTARGVKDAQKRIKNDELVKTMPMGCYRGSEASEEYFRILREEYGIRSEIMLGESKEYVLGFDSVMKPEIDRRFDRDFFDRIWKQAEARQALKNQE